MNERGAKLRVILEGAGLSLEGVPVKCGSCGGWFHLLTARYSAERTVLRGCDLELVRSYRECGWYDFPHDEGTVGDNVQCPQCMMPYRVGDVLAQAESWTQTTLENRLKEERTEPPGPPEKMGDMPMPVVGGEDRGLEAIGGVPDVAETVRKMTWDGHTQADIAKTCGISVYMVREIQNGRKV